MPGDKEEKPGDKKDEENKGSESKQAEGEKKTEKETKTELKSDEPKAKESKPEDSKAKETKPEDTSVKATKPEESKTKEIKLDDSKAKETKPDDAKAKEAKPEASKAKDSKPEESKAKEAKLEDSKTKETKQEESKPGETNSKEEVKPKESPKSKPAVEEPAKQENTDKEKNGVDKPPSDEGANKTTETTLIIDKNQPSDKPKDGNATPNKVEDESKATEETPLTGFPRIFQGLNGRLAFAVAAAALGSAFQHGYNLGVINAPLQLMGDWLNTTSYERSGEYLTETSKTMIISWVVSIYCIGGMIGGAFTGFFSERFGRKGGLLINNAFALVAAVFFGFCKMANSYEMIIIGRFVIGINNGLNAGLAPMYLSEIAPINLRGAIGTVYQLVVTISILFSQIMGLDSLLGTEDCWPILLALTAIPAIFQLLTLPICPESPKFLLINKEQKLEAQRALSWLRDTTNVEEELEEFTNEAEAQKLVPKVSIREICSNPALRIPLIISLMMMMAQQLSGINAAIFFSVKIYEAAGLGEDESLYATIAMGSMNVLMTVVSLILVERAGRKTLMLTGLAGMAIDTLLLTICLALQSDSARWLSYASIVLVILFVVMFATGPGSIPWFIVNELFASNARPTACSIAVAVNWTAAFIVGVGFLPIQQALGPYVFLVFTLLLSLFILFVWKKVPETKGRSIDEITAIFKQQAYGGVGNRV